MMRSVTTGQARLAWSALMLAAVAVVLSTTQQPQLTHADNDKPREPSTAELLGIDRVEQRLGAATPTGRGIIIGHVESLSDGGYIPRVQADRFGDVQFSFASKPAEPSGHASATAMIIYGPRGLAPGVNQVVCWNSTHWMGNGFLRPAGGTDARPGRIRVFTHSWISNTDDVHSRQTLRRVDHLIDQHDVIVVAGVNNNRTSQVPALLGSAYNAIAVGHWSGQSSGGYTLAETAGRCKPDLVAPGGLTSFSTPVVTAVVARLLESADALGPESPARRAEVIKAVLLAGAQKPQGWTQSPGKPLDQHLGAGRARFDNAYEILQAGQPTARKLTQRCGWKFDAMKPADTTSLEFDSPGELREVSLVLVWHRRIDGRMTQDLLSRRPRWNDTPRLANFDLRLHATNDAGETRVVGQSVSEIDNVEHIYATQLPAGRYRIEVVRRDDGLDEPWDYALAWRVER